MTLNLTNILKEKRKRFQVYTTLDSLLSMTNFFDFFSKETFDIFLYALYLFKNLKQKKFSYILFFISCLEKGIISKEFLNKNNLILENLIDHLENQEITKKTKKEIQNEDDLISFDNFSLFDIEKLNKFIIKLINNAQNRFKTPLISEEIFLITLLELAMFEKQSSRFLATLSNTNFLTLRYKLLKNLHRFETILKIKTPQNLLFFSYLIQTQLSSFESKNLLFTKDQQAGILFFRNKLILETLKFNRNKELKKRIYQGILADRKYTI